MLPESFLKDAFIKSGRVWTGPGRGLRLNGPQSVRVYLGLYEVELNRSLRRLLEPGTAAFDIGAQYGYEALLFARMTHARVLTVDGDADQAEVLNRNVAQNDLAHLVQPVTAYVGDGSDATVTLDELADTHFTPGFVKIDIEGSEAAALRGASATLAVCDRWLIETHSLDVEDECLSTLARHAFRVAVQNPRRWLSDWRPASHNRWVIATRDSRTRNRHWPASARQPSVPHPGRSWPAPSRW